MLTTNEPVRQLNSRLEELLRQFQQVKTSFFSGRLRIDTDNPDRYWMFSFYLGRLNWSGGGFYRMDWWRRHLWSVSHNITETQLETLANAQDPFLVSATLSELLNDRKIDRQLLNEVLAKMAEETIFDALQGAYTLEDTFEYRGIPHQATELPIARSLPLIGIKPLVRSAVERWQVWQKIGLADCNPNLQLIITNPDKIPELPLTVRQRQLITEIDPGQTMRDLADRLEEPLEMVAEILYPFIKLGVLALTPPPAIYQPPVLNFMPSVVPQHQPLIACIDDSPIVHHRLEQILRPQGYRFLSVQEPLRAIPALIRAKPDLIFLDLIMPSTNGYEVCKQIRKTPSLKDTPVIILTGKDGAIDKFRSKLVGANNFVSKPIVRDSILNMLFHYLPIANLNN
jgi:two-component system, chemotaxis family, response regulator PixG